MRLLNTVHLSVFVKESDGEDIDPVKDALIRLIPFDIEKEKVGLKVTSASGFDERVIKIIEVTLSKEKHTNAFLKSLMSHLSDEQKAMLLRQFESRCDSEFNFFIRLDKERLLSGEHLITDSGKCFHIRMNIACYPKNLGAAREVAERMLS